MSPDVLVRVRDVRFFHSFGSRMILRETQIREETWENLVKVCDFQSLVVVEHSAQTHQTMNQLPNACEKGGN
jgi:hypothetical protein